MQSLLLRSQTIRPLVVACAVGFLGYCVYFDRKRRSAPDFKQKLREKRLAAIDQLNQSKRLVVNFELPDISNNESLHTFLTDNISMADEAFSNNDYSLAAEYYSIALACTPMSTNLLQLICQAVNEETMKFIEYKLPLVRKKFRDLLESSNRFKLILQSAQEGMREAVLSDEPE